MLTTLTEQDVRDAFYAHQTRGLARAEETTPEALIREFANTDREATENIAQFQRGMTLLRDYIVLVSDRSIVGGRFDAEEAKRVVSPIIEVESGHIATAASYRIVALAQR